MRNRIALVVLILIIAHAGFSQQISGATKDQLSKQPLPQATISLKKQHDNSIVKRGATDNKGAFTFKNIDTGLYSIEVEYIGYNKLVKDSIAVNSAQDKLVLDAFFLSLSGQQLKNVTVTASRPFIVQSADKLILNIAESPVSAGSNAYDVLLKAPGVLADANGNLQVKGRTVNVYIDGRPSNLSNEDLKNMLTNMPSATLDKIEVISNPGARYDAQGGAVINIKTVKNKNFGTNGTFNAGAGVGRFGRYNGGISLNNRSKKVNIYGSYDHTHNAQYYSNSSVRYIAPGLEIRENEYDVRTRNNHTYKAGLDYDISKRTSIGLLARGYTNFRDLSVNNTSVLSRPTADTSSTVFTNGYARFFNPSVNAYLRTTLDKAGKKELTINADYFQYQKIWRDNITTYFYDDKQTEYMPALLLRDDSPADNIVKSLSADYTQPWKKGKLEAGLKTTFTVTDNDVRWENKSDSGWVKDAAKTNQFLYKENINAAYVSYNRGFKKYNVTVGLRAEQTNTEGTSVTLGQVNKRSYFNLFPNFTVSYSKSLTQQFNLSYRKSILRYGFDLVNPFIIYKSQYSYSQGNPYLRPQINHLIELSHVYKYSLFTSLIYTHTVSSLAPVYKQDPVSNLLVSSYDNLASGNLVALTATLNKTIKKKWMSINTVGGFYSKYKFKGEAVTGNSTLTAYISSNNIITLPKKFTFELTALYRSPFASGIYKMNSLFTMSSGIGKSIAKGQGNLKLSVNDIFNTQQFTNTVSGYQQVNGVFTSKAETRVANIAFTWKFGSKTVKANKNRKSSIEDERTRMGAN